MQGLYSVSQIRELESRAFEFIAPFELMKKAASSLLKNILNLKPVPRSMIIFCGSGNNGGDGFVLASLASLKGLEVRAILVGDKANLTPLCAKAMNEAKSAMVNCSAFDEEETLRADLFVDALLGIGIQGKPRGLYAKAIQKFNQCQGIKLACDLPSGLSSDNGEVFDNLCVNADYTVTFIAKKLALRSLDGPDKAGQVIVEPLELEGLLDSSLPKAIECGLEDVKPLRPYRAKNTHKGQFGHVLVAAGTIGMGGAAILASEAAYRVGAGMVSLLTHPNHASALLSRCPEVMVHGFEPTESKKDSTLALLNKADVLLCGPGLIADDPWSGALIKLCLEHKGKKVLDAGALGALAKQKMSKPLNALLTPHPGEARALLGKQEFERLERIEQIKAIFSRYQAACVLKGAGSLVLDKTEATPYLFSLANSGLSTAGTGDVFAGFIAGFLAQGVSEKKAMLLALGAQASSLENALLNESEASLIASDLLSHLAPFFREEA